jgi:hypothetical protein
MPELIESRDVLTDVCGFCGIAIYQMEVAAEFAGKWIDYEERTTGDGSFALCGECRLKVKSVLDMIASGDIEPAVDKRIRTLGEDNR